MGKDLAIFDRHEIRRIFSVVDIVQVLTQSSAYRASRKYWKVLKDRLAKEGSELVTNCYQFKTRMLITAISPQLYPVEFDGVRTTATSQPTP